jgi:O-methyltransferase involved in polyketide biosynthesis
VARVWDFLAGGRDNFDADRKAARQLIRAAPALEHAGYAIREFIGRATRYLAAEEGIRQFIDIGTGIPAAGGIHEVAQSLAPESRVVCVDNDPVVLSHARALLRPAADGATSFIDADVREADKIIAEAGSILDFGRPVAIVMNHLLHYVTRESEVRSILAAMLEAACAGSHLVVVHPASDLDSALPEAARRWNRLSATQAVLRSRSAVTTWFDGLDLVDPGVVPVTAWHPDPDGP